MSQEIQSWQRFYELANLLESYANTGFTFSDTDEAPGPGLAAYMRITSRDPARAATAVEQIDDLLSVGLFSAEIADNIEGLPHIQPPSGTSVEDCLRLARGHLVRLLQDPSAIPRTNPQTSWEWRERFPELHQLLAAYFNQEFYSFYSSESEALDEYVEEIPRTTRVKAAHEIGELLSIVTSEQELDTATTALGLGLLPPERMSLQEWLKTVGRRISVPGDSYAE